MTGANVRLPLPLVRQRPWYPGQFGVPGADHELGLRTHPTGTVFYVDPNYPGASDQRDGTSPDDPLLTVAAALTKCQAFRGDTILVGANDRWPYGARNSDYLLPIQEAVVVTVPGVRIVGAHQSSPTGVVWTPPATGGPCITVHALDVLIEGFAFVGGLVGGTAISAEWDGAAMFGDNLVARHCYFDDDIDTGILLEFVWNGEIHACIFEDCDVYGIRVDPTGSGIRDCRIHGNWFHDCGTSNLSLRGADNCLVAGNFVFSANAQSGALATDELIDLTNGTRNIVTQNVLSCKLPAAANGDYDDACSSAGNPPGGTDAWIQNFLMNGVSIDNPS